MAIRFAAKESAPEPPKTKKPAAAAEIAPPQQDKAAETDETGSVPVPAAGDLFGADSKKAPRGRKKK